MNALVLAASLALTPATLLVNTGQSFSIAIIMSPVSSTISTIKASLTFDPSLLALTSTSFAPRWIPLSESGYDSVDNTSGKVVKTAGYPGGIATTTTLATLTFMAKKSGVASVAIASDSLILDINNENVFAKGGITAITIESVAPVGKVLGASTAPQVVSTAPPPFIAPVAPAPPSPLFSPMLAALATALAILLLAALFRLVRWSFV